MLPTTFYGNQKQPLKYIILAIPELKVSGSAVSHLLRLNQFGGLSIKINVDEVVGESQN